MKKTIILIIVLLSILLLASCSKPQSGSKEKTLYGSWKASDKDDVRYILGKDKSLCIIEYKGRFLYDCKFGTFTLNDSKVIFSIDGNNDIYEYEFFDDAVTLKDERETIVLNRIDDISVQYGSSIGDGIYADEDEEWFVLVDGDKFIGIEIDYDIPSRLVVSKLDRENSTVPSAEADPNTKKKINFKVLVIDDVLYLNSGESFTLVDSSPVSKDNIAGEWLNYDGRLSFAPTGAFYLYGSISGKYSFESGQLVLSCDGKEYRPKCVRFGEYLLIYDLSGIAPSGTFGNYGIFHHM